MPRVVSADLPALTAFVLENPDGDTVDLADVAARLHGYTIFVNGYRVVLSTTEIDPDLPWFNDKFPADERNDEPLEY